VKVRQILHIFVKFYIFSSNSTYFRQILHIFFKLYIFSTLEKDQTAKLWKFVKYLGTSVYQTVELQNKILLLFILN